MITQYNMGIIFDEKIPRTFRFCRGRFGRQKNSFAARSEMEKDGVSCMSCKSMGISESGSMSIRGRGLMLINARLRDWNLLMGPIWAPSTGYLISWNCHLLIWQKKMKENEKLKNFLMEKPNWKWNLLTLVQSLNSSYLVMQRISNFLGKFIFSFSLVSVLCSSTSY